MNKPHKKLDAWKRGIELTVETYRLTENLPEHERFGLMAQMRRSAVSIASNIAEGAARNTSKEFIKFLYTAQRSPSELDTQMIISKELGYFSNTDLDLLNQDMERESKLINGLIKFLQKKI